MSEASPNRDKPRRLRFSYSLRTSLLIVAVTCVWLACINYHAQKQKATVDWVRQFDREPYYDFQFDGHGRVVSNARLPAPDWLVELVGVDYFASVEMLHLDDKPIDDISLLANLPHLRHLELASGDVSDLRPLSHLTRLEHLSLSGNPISDIAPLAGLKKLRRLYAYNTEIEDLSPLAALTNLESVVLMKSRVTDLSPLANHHKLATLDVSDSPVSDVSVLFGLQSLVDLDLSGTQVTAAEIEELAKRLPKCHITFE